MLLKMDGRLKKQVLVLIRGGKFIVRIGIAIVDVVNFVSLAFGVLPENPQIMPNRLDES